MKDGFIRCAACTPETRAADCTANTERIIDMMKNADSEGCSVAVFPELCITGYTCGDLFLSQRLLDSAEKNLLKIADETAKLGLIAVVGLPLRFGNKLLNCAAFLYRGNILGFVPKENIPNYSEFYEARHFSSGRGISSEITFLSGKPVGPIPVGRIIFACENIPELTISAEICEDLWVPCPPSAELAVNGAAIICNPSASDEAAGKSDYRRQLVTSQSASSVCGYIYTSAGFGESSQDMVFAGHNIIAENGTVIAESRKFTTGITYSEIDVKRIFSERRRTTTFMCGKTPDSTIRTVKFSMDIRETELSRKFAKMPFVPQSREKLAERCEDIISMQATGLAVRLKHIGCKSAVIGLSGGLDSTLALIVAVHAFDMLGLDRKGITAVTMPCFGTTKRTKSNACTLAEAYGVSFRDINITAAVRQHFSDIGHDESDHSVTYENSQARERTQILMDVANLTNGIVIGTGDLSELALGWATYNGDHMSMYGVNASIPKTLVRHLTAYEAECSDGALKATLLDILDTPVSPELLPPENGEISQKTEDLVGPYELHDFFLYYTVRLGFEPSKILRLAKLSFRDDYPTEVIEKWLRTFIRRFFSQQFKRSCMPDAPKVGTVTLSPRGDWRMPSDASSAEYIDF